MRYQFYLKFTTVWSSPSLEILAVWSRHSLEILDPKTAESMFLNVLE